MHGDPNASHTRQHYDVPLHAALLRAHTDNSDSSDFRAVIDDLTVQNKKLKKRLRKYEKLHDAHLKDEKLFEVRVHGLSGNKRQELEDLLRKFAMGSAGQTNAIDSASSNPYERVVPTLVTHKTASSSSNFADSAYASNSASNSASGQGSTAMSNSNSGRQPRFDYRRSAKSQHSNIQTYLHDIPEGLLPQHPAVMTEKAKKKLVVRRLEQLFAGTGAVQGDHHHPIQQQEVSQMAARADRSAMEARGQSAGSEGNREAPIMKDDAENQSAEESPKESTRPENTQKIEPGQMVVEQDFAALSPQQRPTRPLDLDPHRAQNPAENFHYIRHLGFSPPDISRMEPFDEGHGWIYLNFLFNLAQLHTLNVTPEFAKKALLDHSSKFELSSDGRKVRWKGGRSITRSASDLSGSSPMEVERSPESRSPRKRAKSSHHKTSAKAPASKRRTMAKLDNKLDYTPLFHHRSSDEDSELSSSEADETESQFLALPGGDSSAMTSSGVRTVSLKQKKKMDNGPMIFYNNAKFCTDLSGEPKAEVAMLYNPILYHTATDHAIGIPQAPEPEYCGVLDARGPLHDAKTLPEAMNLADNPIPDALEVKFPGMTPMSQMSGSSGLCKSPMDMEVSGVGGVCPSDNFSINVKTELKRTGGFANQSAQRKLYPAHIAGLLQESCVQQPKSLKQDVIKTSRRDLPPSELPPASCFMDVDDYDEDSDTESEHSYSPDIYEAHDAPATAPQTIEIPYLSSDESGGEEDDGEDDNDDSKSDGSLDLLATARELDPESIQAREREYDAHMAERLAEEIPAGSSAATAGGGSGFASPASGVGRKEYQDARAEYQRRQASTIASAPSLRKAQTSDDSMVVNGKSP